MNEIGRCLKPNGIFLSHTPAFPHQQAFQDPTHVNIITEATFKNYFDEKQKLAKAYGFKGAFRILKQGWSGPHLISVLTKVD